MMSLLLSRSSDPVGIQVLVGILSALLFWFLTSIFSKKKSSIQNDSDLLVKISDNKKSYDQSEEMTLSKSEISVKENIVRKFVRENFDKACKEIVLSCQGLPKTDQYVKISLKIQDYFALEFDKEPGFNEMVKMAKDNNGDYTMGKYQTRASKGGEIASGKASSVYMAREEGYSRGFQDGKKAYNEFIRFSFSNDIKLIEGEKKEYKYKYYCCNSPYDNENYDEVADNYYPEGYTSEYMKGYKKGYDDAYDFSLKRNGRLK